MSEFAIIDSSSSLTNYMKHFGKTPEEQLEKNRPIMEWLKKQIVQGDTISPAEAEANRQQLANLKETIDSFRPNGSKLYSDE
jgi:hypothetical protein